MNQIDDLARIGTLSDDCEQDDRKGSSDDLDRGEAAATRSSRRLKIERRVTRGRYLQTERLASHLDA